MIVAGDGVREERGGDRKALVEEWRERRERSVLADFMVSSCFCDV